ncbi:hypothetical protein [Mycoplasma hafezii]|uniref:hypothetical protein n=1 Tax=Mycoplasma hafezii TaxID=525886 RepID=UPI003CF27D4C
MKKITIKKIPLKTKIRWIFLGKWPLERKRLPKIQEYLYMTFNNIVVLILLAISIYLLTSINFDEKRSFWVVLIDLLKENVLFKIILTALLTTYLVNLILIVHTYYILSKTEINKWIPIVGTFFAFTYLLAPITIILFAGAYAKNEIAFE